MKQRSEEIGVEDAAVPSHAPIFIVGVGRSGTSLLQSMLAAHSKIAFPPEIAFLRRYVATKKLAKTNRAGGPDAVLGLLESDTRLQRLALDLREVLKSAYRQAGAVSDAAVYRAILRCYAISRGKQRCGDKDPRSVEFLPLIKRLWPNAYVIHVIRDPRDVLASKKKAAWSENRPVVLHAFANRVQLKMGRLWGPVLFGGRYQEVRYEDLLRTSEGTLKEVCKRINLVFEPEILQFSGAAERLVTHSEMAWKKETLGPLLTSNYGKWRSELFPQEIALTEAVCREAFEAFVYENSNALSMLPPHKRVEVQLKRTAIELMDPIYRAYRHMRLLQC